MIRIVGLVTLALVACSAVEGSDGQPREPIAHSALALEGPDLIFVPAQAVLGEAPNTRVVSFPRLFSLDETEVTVDQYGECVTEEACTEPATDTDCNWGVGGRGSHPVNCVTYTQAAIYCAWAGKRLPTEYEWEYAARFNDGRTYPWGSSTSGYETKTNISGSQDGYSTTSPVGTFPDGDSSLGLKDMSGNVWEWTQSPACFNETGACTNCAAGESCSNACDVCETNDRTFKGGSWSHALANSRAAYRTYNEQAYANPVLGFRCAVSE